MGVSPRKTRSDITPKSQPSKAKQTKRKRYNKAYNHYVVNGEHLPENLGEEVEYQISLVNMPNKIKQAYLKACWINDNFFYPPKEEVASMLFRV